MYENTSVAFREWLPSHERRESGASRWPRDMARLGGESKSRHDPTVLGESMIELWHGGHSV